MNGSGSLVAMPMKIFIDFEEAAERLEELIDLAFRQDEVYVCRGGWPVALLTSFSGTKDDFRSDEIAEILADTGPTAPGSKLVEGGKVFSVDEVWVLAAAGRRGGNIIWRRPTMISMTKTGCRDDHRNADRLAGRPVVPPPTVPSSSPARLSLQNTVASRDELAVTIWPQR